MTNLDEKLHNCIEELKTFLSKYEQKLSSRKEELGHHFSVGYSVSGITNILNEVTVNEAIVKRAKALFLSVSHDNDTTDDKIDIIKLRKQNMIEEMIFSNNTVTFSGFDSMVEYLNKEADIVFYKEIFGGLTGVFTCFLNNL